MANQPPLLVSPPAPFFRARLFSPLQGGGGLPGKQERRRTMEACIYFMPGGNCALTETAPYADCRRACAAGACPFEGRERPSRNELTRIEAFRTGIPRHLLLLVPTSHGMIKVRENVLLCGRGANFEFRGYAKIKPPPKSCWPGTLYDGPPSPYAAGAP